MPWVLAIAGIAGAVGYAMLDGLGGGLIGAFLGLAVGLTSLKIAAEGITIKQRRP